MVKKYGLIGEKLSHSISPEIHSEIFKLYSLDGKYDLYEISRESLEQGINKIVESGIEGFNITIPYKVDIMNFLDFISDEAKTIGAVNTVHIKNGKLYGYNTDYFGIGITFDKFNVNLKESSAVLLGSGGAAAAVLQYLVDSNCKNITIVVRNKEKVKNNPRFSKHNIITYDDIDLVKGQDILINSTPCGMFPKIDESPISKDIMDDFKFVFDLIYNPSETLLLKNAKEQSILNCNGLYMLIGQALYAEKIWNHIELDSKHSELETIYKVLEKR